MDIKMGTRTYLEEELVKAREKPKPRKVYTMYWLNMVTQILDVLSKV